jgi:hypothetical protein
VCFPTRLAFELARASSNGQGATTNARPHRDAASLIMPMATRVRIDFILWPRCVTPTSF